MLKLRQRDHCRACGKTSCENKGSNAHTAEFQARVVAAYHERCSLRGVCRIFGISRQTLMTWLKKAAMLPPLAPVLPDDVLELGEVWSFVCRLEPGVSNTPRPDKPAVNDTTYIRLRNEIGHSRLGTSPETTYAEMKQHLMGLIELVKKALAEQP